MDRVKRLVILTAVCLAAAMGLMLVYWVATASLESWRTAVAAGGVAVLLAGIVLLAHRGRVRLAAALLTGLVFFPVVEVSYEYGLGTPSIAGFVLPILLAAFTVGLGACFVVAGVAIAAVWLIGAAAALGWYVPWIPYQVSDLPFTAPFYTVLFLLVAGITAYAVKRP